MSSVPVDEESGIYTCKDDESAVGSTTSKRTSAAMTLCSGVHTTTSGRKSRISVVSAKGGKNDPRNDVDKTYATPPRRTTHQHQEEEPIHSPEYSVTVPKDLESLVSSLDSTGELSLLHWLPTTRTTSLLDSVVGQRGSPNPATAGLNIIGLADESVKSVTTGKEKVKSKTANVFGGGYEDISQRLENRGRNMPIQTYRPSVDKTSRTGGSAPSVADDASDFLEDGVDLVFPVATKHDEKGETESEGDDSLGSPLSLVGKRKDDMSSSLISSSGFRRIVCFLAVLIFLSIGLAVAGTLLVNNKVDIFGTESSAEDSSDSAFLDLINQSSTEAPLPTTEASPTIATSPATTAATDSATTTTIPSTNAHNTSDIFAEEPTTPIESNYTEITETDTTETNSTIVTNSTTLPADEEENQTEEVLCEDDPDFFINIGPRERTCEWLSEQKQDDIDEFCTSEGSLQEFRRACPVTCGSCSDMQV